MATVVEENPYQGVDFNLPEAIDLNEIGSISFLIKQNAVNLPNKGCMFLFYGKQNEGLLTPFQIKKPNKEGWSEVVVPVDVRTMTQ